MTTAAPDPANVSRAIAQVMAQDRGRLLSALIARLRDWSLAEEVLQEAAVSALTHWGRSGVPSSPQGWLLRVAFRKAIDRMRGRARAGQGVRAMQVLAVDEAHEATEEAIPDERLRLIFTCCHPALEEKSRIALTLRVLGGLTTEQIAAAFLDEPATMGQRISRAKAKIAAAGIPFAVPGPELWPERLSAVLGVIYLIFNAGYSAGPDIGRDLAEEAIWLSRMLAALRPGEPEIEGALALLLLIHARRAARTGADGATLPPVEQDRALWDGSAVVEGTALVERALARRRVGPYQVKAAIAACHMQAPPDWPQIAALYGVLMRLEPSSVVALNRAVALAETGAMAQAWALLDGLEGLEDYQPWHAARAAILARLGRRRDAFAAYERAIALATNPGDILFLQARRDAL